VSKVVTVDAFTVVDSIAFRPSVSLQIMATLSPTNGGDDIEIEKDSVVELAGCNVEEKSGRYFCLASHDGTKIGSNSLALGVNYGLNHGMKITTTDGVEYELQMEGGALPTEGRDPMMGMMFDAMKAQFGVTDSD